jgi:anti-sigma regulatory factor (Ser/Thr protein kinase)
VYRVNDYLRDARGNQCAVDIAALVRETGERLLGRDIIGRQRLSPAPSDDSGRVMVYADPGRQRLSPAPSDDSGRVMVYADPGRQRLSPAPSDDSGRVMVYADPGRQRLSPDPSDDSGRVMVYADPERLRSVFENLIRNAVESGDNPDEVSVSIECPPRKRGKEEVRVIVRDRGKGVSEADLPRVFDPFFTRKSTGTGIGLSISKRFIEAAGGTITLANRQGGGAEATVQLAISKAPVPFSPASGKRAPLTDGERAVQYANARDV